MFCNRLRAGILDTIIDILCRHFDAVLVLDAFCHLL